MEADNTKTTLMCTVIAIDHTNLSYRVCSLCERTLPETNNTSSSSLAPCNHFTSATSNAVRPGSTATPFKRVFRIVMSIASDTEVFVVVMFDRAARVVFGCSAQDFFDFAELHPSSAETVGKILEGEMLRVTLSKPKNGNARHPRVVTVVPLKSGFRPVMEVLRELYGFVFYRESQQQEKEKQLYKCSLLT